MAKKDDKNQEENIEESGGSKVVTALIVFIIVIIWLAIFGVLIKLDVGGFGSGVLAPVIKDVPILNMILPNSSEDDKQTEYTSLTEANARIKELEKQLATFTNSDSANSSEIDELKAEVKRLKKFESAQKSFSDRVKRFDRNVVYNDKAPETEEYKKFYEEIEPDNAEKIYKEVCKDFQYTQEISDQADTYSKMEPAKAAAVLSEMSNDLTLVSSILDSMQPSKSALILQSMDPKIAAQVTTKMTAMKK